MSYIWNLPKTGKQDLSEKFPELHPIAIELLVNRGLDSQTAIDEFLHPDYSQDIHDPYLFEDMKTACKRIGKAIDKKELITVYGDYDADGVCSAVILKTVLQKIGAKVEVYLPHREREGYGMNMEAVKNLVEDGTKLIITCDCGVSNIEEVEYAQKNKTDVIITDHHSLPEKLPQAFATIHPQVSKKYPFNHLTGGGVAFKLAQALLRGSKLSDKDKEAEEKWLLDLVAISTVADMMPLLGENRTLLKYGLVVLKKTRRLGLQKLLEVANLDTEKIDARSIGFSIAPRINAAGRMDHANLAYYLMIEKDNKKAKQLAIDLNQSNLDRQKLTEQTVRQAKEQPIDFEDRLFVFYDKDWPAGLTGLVAGRLSRTYSRPVIIMTEVDGQIVASGRSIEGFDINKTLQDNKDILVRFGGHPRAAGFTVLPENKDELVKRLKRAAKKALTKDKLQAELDIELVIDFEKIDWDLVDLLDKFEPYGQENPEPLFMSKGISITAARRVGNDNKHLKLELAKGNKVRGAIGFGLGNREIDLGDKVDIVYNLSINQWNGNREIQLTIRDIKKHE